MILVKYHGHELSMILAACIGPKEKKPQIIEITKFYSKDCLI